MALVAGLGAALDYIAGQADGDLEKGRIALIDNAQVNAAATRAGLVALGFTLFAPTSPSAAATAVAVPEGMDSGTVVKALKAKFKLVTANGQGTMQGKIFRVAHLGFFDRWTRLPSWARSRSSPRTCWGCRCSLARAWRRRRKFLRRRRRASCQLSAFSYCPLILACGIAPRRKTNALESLSLLSMRSAFHFPLQEQLKADS